MATHSPTESEKLATLEEAILEAVLEYQNKTGLIVLSITVHPEVTTTNGLYSSEQSISVAAQKGSISE